MQEELLEAGKAFLGCVCRGGKRLKFFFLFFFLSLLCYLCPWYFIFLFFQTNAQAKNQLFAIMAHAFQSMGITRAKTSGHHKAKNSQCCFWIQQLGDFMEVARLQLSLVPGCDTLCDSLGIPPATAFSSAWLRAASEAVCVVSFTWHSSVEGFAEVQGCDGAGMTNKSKASTVLGTKLFITCSCGRLQGTLLDGQLCRSLS